MSAGETAGDGAYKFVSPGCAGVPDLLVVMPGGESCFMKQFAPWGYQEILYWADCDRSSGGVILGHGAGQDRHHTKCHQRAQIRYVLREKGFDYCTQKGSRGDVPERGANVGAFTAGAIQYGIGDTSKAYGGVKHKCRCVCDQSGEYPYHERGGDVRTLYYHISLSSSIGRFQLGRLR